MHIDGGGGRLDRQATPGSAAEGTARWPTLGRGRDACRKIGRGAGVIRPHGVDADDNREQRGDGRPQAEMSVHDPPATQRETAANGGLPGVYPGLPPRRQLPLGGQLIDDLGDVAAEHLGELVAVDALVPGKLIELPLAEHVLDLPAIDGLVGPGANP